MPASVDLESDSPDPSARSLSMTPTTQQLAMRSRARNRNASGSKRKRADTASAANQGRSNRRRTEEPDSDAEDQRLLEANNDDSDVYDPDQSIEERRAIQRKLRDLGRDLQENLDEYLKGDSNGLRDLLVSANEAGKSIKQTGEAVIDSRLLVTAADISYKKTVRITQGNIAEGIDADELVSKCMSFMRHGASSLEDDAPELSSTQRYRRRRASRGQEGNNSDDESGDDSGDMLNWMHFGHYGCLPNIGRPSIQGHLLGPMSVEKKVRKITKRTAAFRPNDLAETRPEVIKAEDLANVENDLAVICGGILQQLIKTQENVQQTVEELIEDKDEDEQMRIMYQYGLRSTGGIDLLRFTINPKSFAQSVENMFYVSFLIRDGKIKIEYDEEGLPALAPVDEDGEDEAADTRPIKSQAVFTLDMNTWRDIITALDIKKPMIEHRDESEIEEPSATGWYS